MTLSSLSCYTKGVRSITTYTIINKINNKIMQSNIKQKGELPYQITQALHKQFYKEMFIIILVVLIINLIN